MIVATIRKQLHRDTAIMRVGDVVTESMAFVDFDDMNDWALRVNQNHTNCPYAVTICFSLEDIIKAYGHIVENEVN